MCNLLTIEQVCERYGVSRWTVYQWTAKNFIPHLKIQGLVRFREPDLEKWEQSKFMTLTESKLL